MDKHTYYRNFNHIFPEKVADLSDVQAKVWKFFAGMTIGFSIWYLHWRWAVSLNTDAYWFSVYVATSETLCVLGMFIFFYDIWEEPKRRHIVSPDPKKAGGKMVDIFITTYDEDIEVISDTLKDATALSVPHGWCMEIHLLDDGNRQDFANIAAKHGVRYHTRGDNFGFKAGNLKNALLNTEGDFIVIADADTRFMPSFLENTLGYFHDPKVAWVQTPHWFYDVPQGRRIFKYFPWVTGRDPFLTDPKIFFDVIQRRRDRHGASFCCGAGSIHRRSAICKNALTEFSASQVEKGQYMPIQPFLFHVSEDIFTSIQLHGSADRWVSVYHPDPEIRMLSPWSLDAWAAQKLKYAGGTFDIFLNRSAPWRRGMPFKIRLHYLATFWSYLAVFPMLGLFFAPIITAFTGWSPVGSYSVTFFMHLMPVLLCSEIAILFGCKGYDVQASRALSTMTAPYVFQAFIQALRRKKIGFRPTPKTLKSGSEFRFVRIQMMMVLIALSALFYALKQFWDAEVNYTSSLMIVNGFWLIWNILGLIRVIRLAHWSPKPFLE